MNIVSFSQHKYHPFLNVVTIDGEQVNGLWQENEEEIRISFNRDHDLYDYFGIKLRDNSWSGKQLDIVYNWIKENYKEENVSHRTGWVTKNQSWYEWIIKK